MNATVDPAAVTVIIASLDAIEKRLGVIEDDMRRFSHRLQSAIHDVQNVRDEVANLLPE